MKIWRLNLLDIVGAGDEPSSNTFTEMIKIQTVVLIFVLPGMDS
jgi:hypothetical protein